MSKFHRHVALKYQLYNGLFLTLPFQKLEQVGAQLPLFAALCREGLQNGKSPGNIIASFFSDHLKINAADEQMRVLFLFLQLVERQVLLFDALEEAAFTTTHELDALGSLTELLDRLRDQGHDAALQQVLLDYQTRIVLTAHPTQFYPESLLWILQDLTRAVAKNDLGEIERLLLQLGKTSFRNPTAPTPEEEADSLLRAHSSTFYDVFTEMQLRLGGRHPNLLLGFWPGGDRDGNPNVTADTTLKVAKRLKQTALKLHTARLQQLRRHITFKGLLPLLAEMEEQLRFDSYRSAEEYEHDLQRLREHIAEEHNGLFIEEVDAALAALRIFGFFFAALDIRQDSSAHAEFFAEQLAPQGYAERRPSGKVALLEELLSSHNRAPGRKGDAIESLEAMVSIQKDNGERGCHRYIISNTQAAHHVLEVLLLAQWAGSEHLDIVPLFESVDDLQAAEEVMGVLYRSRAYRSHLQRRGERQTVMVGFSDGTKDGGYVTCNWEILQAKERLSRQARAEGIEVLFFDGRGGPPARGGGNTHRFYRALGPRLQQEEVQLTIQGQTISSKFGSRAAARFNSEQLLSAGIEQRLLPREEAEGNELLTLLSQYSYEAYQALKAHPMFVPFLTEQTPLEFYGTLNIASRPAKRRQTEGIEDLRAIPFVGSWAQVKLNVPGYYGLGSALEKLFSEGHEGALQELYHQRLFFRTLCDNAAQALLKSSAALTQHMLSDSRFGPFVQQLHEELRRSEACLLKVSGHKILLQDDELTRESILFREQMVQPLLVIQQYAMAQYRETGCEVHGKLLLKSIPPSINASRNSA